MAVKKKTKKSSTSKKIKTSSPAEPNMKKLVASKDQPRLLEDAEWYRGRFTKSEIGEGQYGHWIRLEFEILGGTMEDGTSTAKGFNGSAFMNCRLEPSQKLWEFAKVFSGGEIEVGDELDLTAYYGERYRVLNENVERKDGSKNSRITKIKKINKK